MPLNDLQKLLSEVSDADLKAAVHEMHSMETTGVLCDGVVRRLAASIARDVTVPTAVALSIAQTYVIRAAAFRWAGAEG